MSTYQKCPPAVHDLVKEVIRGYPEHAPILSAELKIDLVFAYGPRGDDGELQGPALKLHGQPCLGIARIVKLKDRVKGMGDVEISLDGDEWPGMSEAEQRALLDHELYHFSVFLDSNKAPITDDITRPVVKMRRHDFQFGWFTHIAKRHGIASAECQQARQMMDQAGQYFWPNIEGLPEPKLELTAEITESIKDLAGTVNNGGISSMTISSNGHEVIIDQASAKRMIKNCDTILATKK